MSPSLRVLPFAVLPPWNVLPKRWHDSFFLSFESPLLEEVPLRIQLHRQDLVCPVPPISRARTGLGIW